MGFADLHIHTIHSFDGTSSVSAVLQHVAQHTNLQVIAITDHNSMGGIPEALELAPTYGIEVIPGCEISTAEGHLLALFIEKPVDPGLSLVETVRRVGEQGGLCVAAHPGAKGAPSLSFHVIQHALWQPGVRGVLLGVEAFNGCLVYKKINALIEAMSLTLPLAQLGNSDSHVLKTIGLGYSEFSGNSAAELRKALETHRTIVRKQPEMRGINVILSYIPSYFMRKLGWVKYNFKPEEPIKFTRLSYALKTIR